LEYRLGKSIGGNIMAGLLDNLVTIGGTIIAGGLLLKATDVMLGQSKRKSLYDKARGMKSIHERAKRKAKKVV
jgi:hypothetical protein